MGIAAPDTWILFRDLILLLAASSSEFFKLSKRRGIRARPRTLPRSCGRSRAIPIEAKVHRQNSKRRESPRTVAESPKWAFLRWPLNSRSRARAAISCTSSEISIHRGLGCGWHSLMRTVLRVKFPDHQGKYREFSRFRRLATKIKLKKALASLEFLSKFPTQRIGEF